MKKKYTYIDSHKSKDHGKNYDVMYHKDSYDNRVWLLEKSILRKILKNRGDQEILDFATGTGRVAIFLENKKFKKITGIDVSESMLSVAKTELHNTDLIMMDVNDKNLQKKLSKKFDVIIAFRFFLNADPELRKETLKNLRPLLKDNGILIFNIHGNKYSTRMFSDLIRNLVKKVYVAVSKPKSEPFRYNQRVSIGELNKLLKEGKYNIQEIISYSYIPSLLSRFLSLKYWYKFEKKIVSKKILIGTHLIYVCRKFDEN